MRNSLKPAFINPQMMIILFLVVVLVFFLAKNIIPKYMSKIFDLGYKNEVQKISDAIDNLPYAQDVSSFFSTCMYLKSEPENYDQSSGVFIKNYIGVVRECKPQSSDCFAKRYKDKSNADFFPKFEGSCGVLKSSAVFCIKPQIYDSDITGIIDMNGEEGPNILDVDLRTFKIGARKKAFEKSNETVEVKVLDPNQL